ncbi:DUF4142 domain-containing protein [Pseudomonas chlororaphis]|uniref:DUF4142 domain-containing protein n=1 Tax=Pseudomonas chlororaphis TaxID=587753 RepID=UPI0015DD57F8|nr:DUF4142 domain-containing protein [Pseudomonas chlororaphis]QLL10642.1 DUF4142 domain-containing protein [Pseudomonas chlororaphis subsp. aurantiaca]
MNNLLMKRMGLLFLLSAGSLSGAMAASSSDFVEEAAQAGINEIESSKLALEKSTFADVKAFATQMISDHSKANQELLVLAKKLDIQVPDEASLTAKAKQMILEMRDESFDKAYADNQVVAHEKAVELFKKEVASSDKPELKAFAEETLPKLQDHLDMARHLQSKTK